MFPDVFPTPFPFFVYVFIGKWQPDTKCAMSMALLTFYVNVFGVNLPSGRWVAMPCSPCCRPFSRFHNRCRHMLLNTYLACQLLGVMWQKLRKELFSKTFALFKSFYIYFNYILESPLIGIVFEKLTTIYIL